MVPSTPTCAYPTSHITPSPVTAAPKKPKLRSFGPPEEKPFSGQNKGPLKMSKAKLVVKKKSPAAPKKVPAAATNASTGASGQGSASIGVPKSAPAKKATPAKKTRGSAGGNILMQSIYGGFRKKACEKKSVLDRPTARANDEFERLNGGKSRRQVAKAREDASRFSKKKEAAEAVKVFRVMDLPEELRAMVWRYAVVRPKGFVWPENEFGREQPDLAMACRQVRGEVLPIFYSDNIFAINLLRYPSKPTKEEPGISTIKRWGKALDGTIKQPSWFSYIRRWVFSYPGSDLKMASSSGKVLQDDAGFMISINFSKRQRDGVSWDASIECHRDARCLQESYEQYGICKIQTVPAKLNDAVIAVTEGLKGKDLAVDMIYRMAEQIQKSVPEVGDLRCKELGVQDFGIDGVVWSTEA